jgi:phage virion morphogenesis protein
MTGVTLTATLSAAQALAGMQRVAAIGIHPAPLLRQIGVALADSTRNRFNEGVDPAGNAWKPLLPAYASVKRGSHILVGMGMSGGLQGSITFDTGANSVAIGSGKIYAAVHQFGAIIRPKSKKALVFRMGGALVFAKQVTIPARPYLGLSKADEAEIAALSAKFIAAQLHH